MSLSPSCWCSGVLRLRVFSTVSPASCPVVFPRGELGGFSPRAWWSRGEAGAVPFPAPRAGGCRCTWPSASTAPAGPWGCLCTLREHAGLQEPAHGVFARGEGPSMSSAAARTRISTTASGGVLRRTRRWTSERHVTVAVSSRRPGVKGAAFRAGRGRSQ